MRRLIPPLAAALLTGACAVPASPPSVASKGAADLALAGPAVVLAPDWWTAIGDPQLARPAVDLGHHRVLEVGPLHQRREDGLEDREGLEAAHQDLVDGEQEAEVALPGLDGGGHGRGNPTPM